jgi:arsenate reductase (thioredoxin)
MTRKPRVLVICTGNSMRSQIAEGVLRMDLGNQIEVFSAGTHPGSVHRLAVAALAAIGYDASGHRSKSVNEFLDMPMDLVITVCDSAHEVCPVFPNARKTVHKGYPDPVYCNPGEEMSTVMAEIRDRMRCELRDLVIRELNLPVRPE